jgi:tetratricopeptide (TPR) repeat protein
MPYFGGASLDQVLRGLTSRPPGSRSGEQVLEVLDRLEARHPAPREEHVPSRDQLARSNYVEVVCRFGAILAETLHHAHQRGLVHFDVKPSNVLLAADGQPMLLDFHLARAPVPAASPAPSWLGGTPAYMAPEHAQAFQAVRRRAIIQTAVDQRADVYSLGVLLHEALGGERPEPGQEVFTPLSRLNPNVSRGLEGIVHKCLTPSPEDRYPDAAALADDLRRHLEDRPLRHVPNRSLIERWRKWRRRRPLALRVIVLAFVLLGALTAAAVLVGVRWQDHRHRAEQALRESRELMIAHRHDDAVRRLMLGLDYSKAMPGNGELTAALERHLHLAQRARKAAEVHAFADTLRHAYLLNTMSLRMTRVLSAGCRQAWEGHEQLLDRSPTPLELTIEADIRPDLLDIAVCRADLHFQLASPAQAADARREALRILEDAEKLLGGSPALYREKGKHARALGMSEVARQASADAERTIARTAWDHLSLARCLLRDGEAQQALDELNRMKELPPRGFLASFHRGVCTHRLKRHEEAIHAFCECIGADPQSAESHLFRGRAFAALGRPEKALTDFDRALQLKPSMTEAVLARGLVYLGERRHRDARADLNLALKLGADPASKEARLLRDRLDAGDGADQSGGK